MSELTLKMLSGTEIPQIGLGVFEAHGQEAVQSIIDGVEVGYRLFDTAAFYENEEEVGEGIKNCGLKREEIFLTTKVWPDEMFPGKVEASLEASLKKLDTDYLDLFLLHWPVNDVEYSWKYLEKMKAQGVVRHIGVSNFQKCHLEKLSTYANECPELNQIESNPFFAQADLVAYCQELGIIAQSWGPLGKARILQDPTLMAMAEKYGKSVAQIILRWQVSRGVAVIPKTVHKERMIENRNLFDFELSQEDILIINGMETGKTDRHYHPGFSWKE